MQWRKIDPNKIVLTEEDTDKFVSYKVLSKPGDKVIVKVQTHVDVESLKVSQTLKVIQEFVDSGIYRHKEWRGLAMHGDWECAPDCPVCELQMKLTERFPNLRNSIKKGTN